MKPGTHCYELHRILQDGRWHSTAELLRAVPCIVHSRISSLRIDHGFTIEHRTTGAGAKGHEYRLVGGLSGDEPWRGDPGRQCSASLASGPPGPSSPLSPSGALNAGVAQTPASPSGPERKSDRLLTGGTRPGTPAPALSAHRPPPATGGSGGAHPTEPLDVAAEERQTGRLTPNPASDRSLPARGSGSSPPPHVAACAGASASTSSGLGPLSEGEGGAGVSAPLSAPPREAAVTASPPSESGPGWWEPSPPAPSLEDGAAAGGAPPTSRQLSLLEAA